MSRWLHHPLFRWTLLTWGGSSLSIAFARSECDGPGSYAAVFVVVAAATIGLARLELWLRSRQRRFLANALLLGATLHVVPPLIVWLVWWSNMDRWPRSIEFLLSLDLYAGVAVVELVSAPFKSGFGRALLWWSAALATTLAALLHLAAAWGAGIVLLPIGRPLRRSFLRTFQPGAERSFEDRLPPG